MSALLRYQQLLTQSQLPAIKRFRHEQWVAAAQATLNKTASTKEICFRWSHAADEILRRAWQSAGLDKMPIALFALGKLGAQELNLSSDVDLVAISGMSPTPEMLKAFREFTKIVSEPDEFGFALRLDFDLRPGGRFGPTISTLKETENYYWTQGATWERLALVRLRPLIGDKEVQSGMMDLAQKFTYRKYVDYSFLQQLKSLRAQIHNYYEDENNINIKLNVGGIRDMELFCHALQVIHGGRNLEVRHHNTDEAFSRLISHNLYDENSLEFLRTSYWYWRQIENEIQAQEDQQTHLLPRNNAIVPEFQSNSVKVDTIVGDLLGKTSRKPMLPSTLEEQKAWLASKGFSKRSQGEVWPRLFELTAKSTRSSDENMRQEFLFQFVEQLSAVGLDKNLGLHLLDDFVRATRAKATFFSLFVSEPRLTRDLARLFSISPYLGGILASRPELVDSFLFKAQAAPPQNIEDLLEYLTEKRLLGEIFSAAAFLESGNVEVLGREVSLTADQIAETLLQRLCQEFQSAPIGILALGKWGGQELGLHSDLDFIFVSESAPGPNEQKVAKRFISRLTEPHRGGMIYSVDLRLRPSGKAGPFLIDRNKLCEFLATAAEPWERQSYSRARTIGATFEDLDKTIRQTVADRGLSREELLSLRDIREKLLHGKSHSISLKYSEGGLLDIEFAAQLALLGQKNTPSSAATVEMLNTAEKKMEQKNILKKSYLWLRRIEQLYRIVSDSSEDAMAVDQEAFVRLSNVLKTNPESLYEQLVSTLEVSREAVKGLDPVYSSG